MKVIEIKSGTRIEQRTDFRWAAYIWYRRIFVGRFEDCVIALKWRRVNNIQSYPLEDKK